MKEKILVFIIGLLVGAVITALGFLIFEKVNKNQMPNDEKVQRMEMFDENMPKRPDEDMKNDDNRPEPKNMYFKNN